MIGDLARLWRCYREFARIGFVNILAFRLRYYTGVVTYLISVSVYYFIWKEAGGDVRSAAVMRDGNLLLNAH